MCRNGRYTERGIKERHGYASERFRIEPDFAIKIDPALGPLGVLLEPASVLAKAWDHIRSIGARAAWVPERVLVTGAGPVGLLAALMGVQQGYQVHVFDRNTSGPKPDIVRALGATYHTSLDDLRTTPDIVLECTGSTSVVLNVIGLIAPGGIVCLTGAPPRKRFVSLDLGQLSREMVIENGVIFGSVNANRRHFELAADALRQADHDWLARLISRRVSLADWQQALQRRPGEVKVVLDFEAR
jgi:threonine dehydrogenase-like Zn-dependent dehydrogenase